MRGAEASTHRLRAAHARVRPARSPSGAAFSLQVGSPGTSVWGVFPIFEGAVCVVVRTKYTAKPGQRWRSRRGAQLQPLCRRHFLTQVS